MIRASALAAGVLVAALAGCLPQETTSRPQVADDPADKDAVATVGQKTVVGNTDPIPVTGVGLVHGLRGTGSSPPADGWRAALEQAIRRNKGNPKEVLDDPARTTSLVVVSAVIPRGARVGDRLPVTVALPAGSKTTSLKYGRLWPCDLTNVEFAGAARQAVANSGAGVPNSPLLAESTLLKGHRLAVAEGPLVAGFVDKPSEGEEPTGPRAGVIWDGAKCQLDRPYYFLLNDDTPQPRLAMVIAERLNAVFHSPGDKTSKTADAKVQGKPIVVALVPPAYRLNHDRFLLVARQVPLTPVGPDHPYRKQLESDLLRPELALVSAVKLEALGPDSRQPLRVGLQSDSPWVRFAAAEALAYLGHADGAKDLAELAEKHPSLRTHALTALASLDDAICLDQLAELMKKPDPELRYGAFVALRSADENHPAIKGVKLHDSFWVHQVADGSPAAVHVSTDRRSEVVLFGGPFPLSGPLSVPLGKEFTVTLKAGEPTATLTKVTTKDGEPTAVEARCVADVLAVVKGIGELGGTYAEAAEFVRRAEQAGAVGAAVHYDASPRGLTVQALAQIARSDPSVERADLEVARAGTADVVQTSHDLPTDADGVKAKPAPAELGPALNRDPGRLFGSKK